MAYSSADLLAAIKRNQTLTSSVFRFTDAAIFSMADEEIKATVVPTILSLQAERLLFNEKIPLVASQSRYDVPYRAVSSQIRKVILQDTATTTPNWTRDLNLLRLEDGVMNTQTGDPSGFYFGERNKFILVPGVGATTSEYLSLTYPICHPTLVSDTEVAIISSVNYSTGVITLAANAPTDWTTSLYYDFLIANRRSTPQTLAIDKVPTAVVTNTITFTVADIPLGLVAGDKITQANQSDVLLLPDECFNYLCKAVGIKVLEARSDLKALQEANPKLDKARVMMESILTPRTRGAGIIIVNNNSLIRQSNRRRRIGISV